MTFSNPARDAVAAAPGYVRALLDVLGPRDPLEVLAQLLPWLDQRLAGLSEERLRRPEAPGKWSVVEILQHLADVEMVYGIRGRMVLAEDRPVIQGFDQDRWALRFRYADSAPTLALDQLRGLRVANLVLWRRLIPADLAREGLHSERGPESMEHMLRLMAAHDLVHRRQIERVLG